GAREGRGLGGAAVPEHPAVVEPGPARALRGVRPPARAQDLLRRDAPRLGAVLDGGGGLLVRAAPALGRAAPELQAPPATAQRVRPAAHLLQRPARGERGRGAAPP